MSHHGTLRWTDFEGLITTKPIETRVSADNGYVGMVSLVPSLGKNKHSCGFGTLFSTEKRKIDLTVNIGAGDAVPCVTYGVTHF